MIRSLTHLLVRPFLIAALLLGLPLSQAAFAATIKLSVVTDPVDGGSVPAPIDGFRYLVEEDPMYKPQLPVPGAPGGGVIDLDNLSFNFHKSHTPNALFRSVSRGDITGEVLSGNTADIWVPDNGSYFVSVLPLGGAGTLGGGAVTVTQDARAGGAGRPLIVRVTKTPIPTGNLTIWVFHDNNPTNGAWDLDEEFLACEDVDKNGQCGDAADVPFTIELEDAGGQYGGAAAGIANWNAYGDPIGTKYGPSADPSVLGDPIYPAGNAVNGFIVTPEQSGVNIGKVTLENLFPAKYGTMVVPPHIGGWIQTTSIEGKNVNDAWIKANEPANFVEFGPPGPHTFFGFVREFNCLTEAVGDPSYDANCADTGYTALPAGGATISGDIVNNHLSRSPNLRFDDGEPFEGCRVTVNIGVAGRTIYHQPCGPDAHFAIDNLAPGSYSLSIFDDGLNMVLANHAFSVIANPAGTVDADGADAPYSVLAAFSTGGQTAGGTGGGTAAETNLCSNGTCALGTVPVFDWFHFLDTWVFNDTNENGIWDNGEEPMPADSSATQIRWRDGRIYDGLPIDVFGSAPIEQTFPFFHWLVAEVDFGKFKATGATFITDNGSLFDNSTTPPTPIQDPLLPVRGYTAQPQLASACQEADGTPIDGCSIYADLANGNPSTNGAFATLGAARVQTGQVLTQAFQGFLGQKNTMLFGKASYGEGENGGISGVAVYAVTRAENDPRYAAAEPWEPGIPRVQFALYRDANDDGIPDDGPDSTTDNTTAPDVVNVDLPDVDNYPLGNFPGAEDVDLNGNGVFDRGDAIDITWSDSWDDSLPTNCQGSNAGLGGLPDTACFDGLRNWNQIRPGVFDGGYAFPSDSYDSDPSPDSNGMVTGADLASYIPSGYYVVQSFAPPGYEPLREEHKNVEHGDSYRPQLLPPECVGMPHTVPQWQTQVSDASGNLLTNFYDGTEFQAPFAGDVRPLCDMKKIRVAQGKNAAADFHLMTPVPKAAHVVGGVINDLANEFNIAAPTFGEKFAPPWLPVAFYDWQGNEITRVYTDEFGKYNAMLPSTYTVSVPSPSGVSPNMVTACMNDAGDIDTNNDGIADTPDPRHNPQYSQFCYTFQYMPGATTYLDTPVQQVAAFAGSGNQLDCDAAYGTPMIAQVRSTDYAGPYVDLTGGPKALTITSQGMQAVPNPSVAELDPQATILRDYSFGTTAGTVWLDELELWETTVGNPTGLINLGSVPGSSVSWGPNEITATIPSGINRGRYQLLIENSDGVMSPIGVTVTVGPLRLNNRIVREVPGMYPTIQAAVDASRRGDMILVAAGDYDEMVIVSEPVYIQGAGAAVTTINARSVPAEKVTQWRTKIIEELAGAYDTLPGQEVAELFVTEEGAGLTVVGKASGNSDNRFLNNSARRGTFDGFTIKGASTGGGIFINGYINGFQASNNVINGNQGTYGGGIRVGHLALSTVQPDGSLAYTDAQNDNLWIHHNLITRNGTINGAGGGIALYAGAQNYQITDNLICGNYAATDGAGIGHLGLSDGGEIMDNQILFNQSFRQTPGFDTDGGGILIAGADGLNGPVSPGAGNNIRIYRNLIQGNNAGAGEGAGIALRKVNGEDVAQRPRNKNRWNRVRIFSNSIVNNVAGLRGGAISLKDSARVEIYNNTIANNMSTATAGAAFDLGGLTLSSPQIAGIASHGHSVGLSGLPNERDEPRYNVDFSNPMMINNIIHNNQAFNYELGATPSGVTVFGYWDMGVVDAAGNLDPQWSLLTAPVGFGSDNVTLPAGGDLFVAGYSNYGPGTAPASPTEFGTVQTAPAVDEGGNWIDVRYAPLSINDIDPVNAGEQKSNYHLLGTATAAIDGGDPSMGSRTDVNQDIDKEPGVVGTIDIGSDEVQ